ncbi:MULTISPECIES: hypothetical protein [Citrobacter]|uniref:Uncharacterized protein n=1 Tax=Citrobacter portucalensis TaxID=1639133 RepID=A0AAJ1JRC5_9ENTR|nr:MULTISPECIES: hypothetical protein [Citrobacter]MBJ8938582.1 hypothetical protein [Citrobacter koseri]MDE9625426.1 hypothetical protein [Citrobacter portucalensis]PWY09688.1 hypothetical protein DL345_08670 [Citrobacter koseri]HBC9089349.1 hypothetical protein [Citrobacter koseri]
MARYRVHFDLVQYSKVGNSKSTATTSETVEAESESVALAIAKDKVKNKSTAKGREINVRKIEKLR